MSNMISKFLGKIINLFFKKIINKALSYNNALIIFRNGSAIGDHLYMTSVLREIYLQNKKIILFSNYYELFINNQRIYKLFKFKSNSFIWFFLNNLKGECILEFRSLNDKKSNKHFLFYHKDKYIHLSQAMSEHFNLNLSYKDIKNEFFFTKKELINYEKNIKLPEKFSLIQSNAKQTYTANKEWNLEGMQGIINHFHSIHWIQIGKSDETKLKNCDYKLDLNLRELAYVIFKCEFLVVYEGLFNHLASCFNKKIFLIHTGFLPKEAFNYKNNILIENNKSYPCYPCFDIDCENHKYFTKRNIKIENVIEKIKSNLV